MAYTDLNALLAGSSSSRSYFLSLPVELQMQLHRREELIHAAEDLHRVALLLARQREWDRPWNGP